MRLRFIKLKSGLKLMVLVISSGIVLLSSVFTSSAVGIDDVRDLLSIERYDNMYTEDEITDIFRGYNAISHNNFLYSLIGDTKVVEEINKLNSNLRVGLEGEIEKKENELKSSFNESKNVYSIMRLKTEIGRLQTELSNVGKNRDILEVKYEENTYEEDYKNILRNREEVKNYKDIGVIGSDFKTIVSSGFYLLRPFGYGMDTNEKILGNHNGIDILAQTNSNIKCMWNGVVESIYREDRGYTVVVNHDNGLKTVYSHIKSVSVSEGGIIKQYDKIGTVGLYEEGKEPHLHLEVVFDGKNVNPIMFFGEIGKNALKGYISNTPNVSKEIKESLNLIKDKPSIATVEVEKEEEQIIYGETDLKPSKDFKLPDTSNEKIN